MSAISYGPASGKQALSTGEPWPEAVKKKGGKAGHLSGIEAEEPK